MLCARIRPDRMVAEIKRAKSPNSLSVKNPGEAYWVDAGERGKGRKSAEIGEYHDPTDPSGFALPWNPTRAANGNYNRRDKVWWDPGDGGGGRIWTSWFQSNLSEPGTNTDWRDWSLRGNDPWEPDGFYEPGMFVEHDDIVWELGVMSFGGSGLEVGEPGTAGGGDWVDRSARPVKVTKKRAAKRTT